MRGHIQIMAGLVLLFGAGTGGAAEGSREDWTALETLRGQRVLDVHLEGKGLGEPEARSYLEIRPGDRFSIGAVRRSVKLLYHTGLFGQVSVTATKSEDGIVMTFRLAPKRRVLSVEYEGNDLLADSALSRLSRLRRGDEFDRWKMDSAAADMRDLHAKRGYRRTQIVPKVTGPDEGDVDVAYFIQEGEPTRISRLWFRGDTRFKASKLEARLGLHRGDVVDVDALDEALEELKAYFLAQGYLEVRITNPGIDTQMQALWEVVTIEIQAGHQIEFDFEGNQILSTRELLPELETDHEGAYDAYVLRDLSDKIEERYRKQGYARVRVDPQAVSTGSKKSVTFVVDEGPRVTVREVRLEGNSAFTDSELRRYFDSAMLDAIPQKLIGQPVDRGDMDPLGGGHPWRWEPRRVNRSQGFLSELIPETVYLREPYEKAVEQIADLYRSKGYVDVQIDTPLLSYGQGGSSLYITIPVQEGPQTRVESITFEGNQQLSSLDLVQVGDQHTGLVRPGAPLNLYGVEELRKELIRTYASKGYVYTRISQDLQYSDDRMLVEVRYVIEEGLRVKVGRVLVRGNLVTDPKVFRYTLTLRSGELFTPDRVSESREDLLSLGVFSGVDIKMLDPDTQEETKDVVVTVRERLPHAFALSPGISSAEGVRLAVDYTQRNLFGYALELVLRTKVNYFVFYPLLKTAVRERFEELGFLGGLEGWVAAGLHWPHVWWWGKGVAARIDLVGLRDHAASYDLTKVSLVPGLDFELARGVTLTTEYEIEYDFLGCPTVACGGATAEQLGRLDEGSLVLGQLRPVLSWDRRDNIFRPHRGTFMTLRTELAHNMLPDQEVLYVKLDGLLTGYVPLGRNTTLALSIRAGGIIHLTDDSRTPSHKRFFLGGRNTIRGFLEEDLIPADQEPPCVPSDDPGECEYLSLGGNAYLNLKGELRFPLVPDVVEGAFFVDVGNLWVDLSNMDPFDLRPSAGFGVRFVTPIGPVAFDFGFNLAPDSAREEDIFHLHFNIGVF